MADFSRAIEIDPNYAWAIMNRGCVLRLAGRYEEALADLNRAIEINPQSSFSITNRGVVHRVAGRYEDALADFSRAIEIDPNNGWTQYEKTVALYATRNPEYEISALRAIELCSPHLSGDSNSIADTGNLFLLYCLMSQWEEADRCISAFLDRDPEPGYLVELCTVTETLRPLVPSAGERLSVFRGRLNARLVQ
ncbi:tetratricopeptide repeat protein [Streptomyces sp. NPDC055058]